MLITYSEPLEQSRNTWITYFLLRIRQNQNNLISVVGPSGSGKTWTAISICEMISRQNNIPFTINNIVFGLKELMDLINSEKLKKGSCIIFDEPQVSISSREFQSETNRVFNYLLTTFRHRNFILFFCTPYEDLLDLSSRKMFHAKFITQSIDRKNKMVQVRPFLMEYNSYQSKFYQKFLRVSYREPGESINSVKAIKSWSIPRPSKEMIKVYETKRLIWTDKLNTEIQDRLESYERRTAIKDDRKEPTDLQQEALTKFKHYKGDIKAVAKDMDISVQMVYNHLNGAESKGYKRYKA